MTISDATEIFITIKTTFKAIKPPKYKYADLSLLKQWHEELQGLKPYFISNPLYTNLMNGITQTIVRKEKIAKGTWNTLSERSINKSIPPVTKQKNTEIESCHEWDDPHTGQKCFINGHWAAKNYMVMDVLAFIFLLKEGKDILPKKMEPIFEDISSIKTREEELEKSKTEQLISHLSPLSDVSIQEIMGRFEHVITFPDQIFRRFTGKSYTSNEILKLLYETSRVEFKLVYPVRLLDKKNFKEKHYMMNFFSRLFEFGYRDDDASSDIKNRKYFVVFNSLLGQLFVHNLKTKNYDFIDNRFYSLPDLAQLLYRRFLQHNTYMQIPLNFDTIVKGLNLRDKNITNLASTVKASALDPLRDAGYIESYHEEQGLNGRKFTIQKTGKQLSKN